MKPLEKEEQGRFDAVIRRTNELSGIYRNAAAKSGLSVNEFWIWYTLMGEDRELTQQEVGLLCGLPKQTVNTIVRGMVRQKQATLEKIPLDRSRKRIRLTAAGRAFGERLMACTMSAERAAFGALSEEAQLGALRFLDEYLPGLRRAMED